MIRTQAATTLTPTGGTAGAPGEIAIILAGLGSRVARNGGDVADAHAELRQLSNASWLAPFPDALTAEHLNNGDCLRPSEVPAYCCFPDAEWNGQRVALRIAPGAVGSASVTVGESGNGQATTAAFQAIIQAFARLERPGLDISGLNSLLANSGIQYSYSPSDQLSIFLWGVYRESMARLSYLARDFPNEPAEALPFPSFLHGVYLQAEDFPGLNPFQFDIAELLFSVFSSPTSQTPVKTFLSRSGGLANYSAADPVSAFNVHEAQSAQVKLRTAVTKLNEDLVEFHEDFFVFLSTIWEREMQTQVLALQQRLEDAKEAAGNRGLADLARVLGVAASAIRTLSSAGEEKDWKQFGNSLADLFKATSEARSILDRGHTVDELETAYKEILEAQRELRRIIDDRKQRFIEEKVQVAREVSELNVIFEGHVRHARLLADDLLRLTLFQYIGDPSGPAKVRLRRNLDNVSKLALHYPNEAVSFDGITKFRECGGRSVPLCEAIKSQQFVGCVKLPATGDTGYEV